MNLAGIVTLYVLFFNTIEPRGPSILVNHFNSFNSIINNNIVKKGDGVPKEHISDVLIEEPANSVS